MSLQKHKHAETIKAWADGAEVEVHTGEWVNCLNQVTWNTNFQHRVKPVCEYAIEKIREIGGEEAVELYIYWLDGGKIEVVLDNGQDDCWAEMDAPSENPFKEFTDCYSSFKYRKKKRKVKQVLWINPNRIGATHIESKWLSEATDCYGCGGNIWVKTDVTREIQFDKITCTKLTEMI